VTVQIATAERAREDSSRDFWTFWCGQMISNFGSSFTVFALPLIVFQLTGSAVNLALTSAAEFAPFLLFGLVIGAWVDRLDRKRLMVAVDAARAVALATVPLLSAAGALSVWWVYGVGFVSSTLWIAFSAAEFAALPSLVRHEDLVTANGRVQAGYQAAQVVGPVVAGVVVGAGVPVADVFAVDAATFLVSAACVALVRRSFNAGTTSARASVRKDVVEGLRYVLSHPVLRNISLMMALINFFATPVWVELVLFAKVRLDASNAQVAFLFSAGSVGVVALSLAAGRVRRYVSFPQAILGALMLYGLSMVALSLTREYWAAVPIWALVAGLATFFNINTASLRQAIVPSHLLGRVMAIAGVLAWSANPLGALVGGWAIGGTDVALVYAVAGSVIAAVACAFAFTALGRAERFIPARQTPDGRG
jgi:MFS family permease